MKLLRDFIGCEVNRSMMDDPGLLKETGLVPRYLPDVFEDFDEFDYLAPYENDNKLVLSAAIENGKLMRLIIGWAAPDDPEDALRPLDEEELEHALKLHGENLTKFLERISS